MQIKAETENLVNPLAWKKQPRFRNKGEVFKYQYEISKQTGSSKYIHYIVQKSPVTETGPEIIKFKGQKTTILSFPTSHKREHDKDLILFNYIELGFCASLKISV